jgi:heat shock protein HslJ
MKAMSLFSIVLAALTSLAMLAGCAQTDGDEPGDAVAAGLGDPMPGGTRWVLETLGERPIEVPEDTDERPYLMFGAEDRGVSGFTGVNFVSGTYERDGDALRFDPLIMTKRAGPPALMQQETEFTQALEQTAGWRMREADLELLDADGNALARFRAGGDGVAAPVPAGE